MAFCRQVNETTTGRTQKVDTTGGSSLSSSAALRCSSLHPIPSRLEWRFLSLRRTWTNARWQQEPPETYIRALCIRSFLFTFSHIVGRLKSSHFVQASSSRFSAYTCTSSCIRHSSLIRTQSWCLLLKSLLPADSSQTPRQLPYARSSVSYTCYWDRSIDCWLSVPVITPLYLFPSAYTQLTPEYPN